MARTYWAERAEAIRVFRRALRDYRFTQDLEHDALMELRASFTPEQERLFWRWERMREYMRGVADGLTDEFWLRRDA